jgi:hypothetical protein
MSETTNTSKAGMDHNTDLSILQRIKKLLALAVVKTSTRRPWRQRAHKNYSISTG